MPGGREHVERNLSGTGLLRRTIADFREIERELQAAEKRVGLKVSTDSLLIGRLARIRYSMRVRATPTAP